VPVRSDGKISLELVGEVQAAGIEPDRLSRILNERYGTELRDPRVTVVVRGFGGQVHVTGEVDHSTAIPFGTGLTALEAISGAGGFRDTAKIDSVILIRRTDAGFQGYRLALDQALSGKDLSADVALRPSDVLHVPKSTIAQMNLFVDQYVRKNLPIQPAIAIPLP
jgi:protein involved in polysaccharide export with SLBB domain